MSRRASSRTDLVDQLHNLVGRIPQPDDLLQDLGRCRHGAHQGDDASRNREWVGHGARQLVEPWLFRRDDRPSLPALVVGRMGGSRWRKAPFIHSRESEADVHAGSRKAGHPTFASRSPTGEGIRSSHGARLRYRGTHSVNLWSAARPVLTTPVGPQDPGNSAL